LHLLPIGGLLIAIAACTAPSDDDSKEGPKPAPEASFPKGEAEPAATDVILGERIRFTGADGKVVVPRPGTHRLTAGDNLLRLERAGSAIELKASPARTSTNSMRPRRC